MSLKSLRSLGSLTSFSNSIDKLWKMAEKETKKAKPNLQKLNIQVNYMVQMIYRQAIQNDQKERELHSSLIKKFKDLAMARENLFQL